MRIESSVTSLSWIPSEAIAAHDRQAALRDRAWRTTTRRRPTSIDDLDALRDADRFRFANRLEAWIEVEDGNIVGHGQSGGGLIGSTTLRVGQQAGRLPGHRAARAAPRPRGERRRGPLHPDRRAAAPACPPRAGCSRAPFVQFAAPLAWTTLASRCAPTGRRRSELTGASCSPGTGSTTTRGSSREVRADRLRQLVPEAFGKHSPWGDQDSPALTTEVESALERQLSPPLMRGAKPPKIRKVKAGKIITEQGAERGRRLLGARRRGRASRSTGSALAEYGPGSLHGRAGRPRGRAAHLHAPRRHGVQAGRVPGDQLDHDALAEFSTRHRREDER